VLGEEVLNEAPPATEASIVKHTMCCCSFLNTDIFAIQGGKYKL